MVAAAAPQLDVAELKQRVNLLDLIGQDARLRKVSTTRGGEYAGPCPFCGGRDRLRVQPDAGLWWCRQCSPGDHWQDAIGYVQLRDGLSFRDACESLGARPQSILPPRRALPPAPAEEEQPPSPVWRERAQEWAETCRETLWSEAGAGARAYLHDRGLTDGTIRRAALGVNLTKRFDALDAWGLEPRDRHDKGISLARGITIPWRVSGEVWHLKIRRPDKDLSDGGPKYLAVRGGRPLLFGIDQLDGQRVVGLCEGEFDALLFQQEAGDLLAAVSLGGATRSLSPTVRRALLGVPLLLVAYDADDAGAKGAAGIARASARMERVLPPAGKDLTEFHQQGGRLHDWASFHLRRLGVLAPLAAPAPPPPAPVSGAPGPALRAERLDARYPLHVLWSSEQGWLRVRDCITGEWHLIQAKDAPRSWIPRRAHVPQA